MVRPVCLWGEMELSCAFMSDKVRVTNLARICVCVLCVSGVKWTSRAPSAPGWVRSDARARPLDTGVGRFAANSLLAPRARDVGAKKSLRDFFCFAQNY